jgi:hypothetical protein
VTNERIAEGRLVMDAALRTTPECIAASRFESPLGAADAAHLASCAHCQAELALFRSFHDTSPLAAREAADVEWLASGLRQRSAPNRVAAFPTARTARAGIGRFLPGLAAAAVLLVGIGFFARQREPELRTPVGGSAAYRSLRLELVAPKGDLEVAPASLRWQAVSGATRYDVEVIAVDKAPLWRGASATAQVALPESLAAQLLPGRTVLWRVVAYDAAGRTLAESNPEPFRVAMPPGGKD